jgi:RimJ/RimL family protein N-acetyltransferase
VAAEVLPARQPVFASRRLRFRLFTPADIGHLVASARDYGGSDATAGLPPPYALHCDWMRRGLAAVPAGVEPIEWTTCRTRDDRVVGYGCLHPLDAGRRQAQVQFWIVRGADESVHGEPAECARAILQFALERLRFERVIALQLVRQPRVARILEACGMSEDGLLRKRLVGDGLMEDVACWSVRGCDRK